MKEYLVKTAQVAIVLVSVSIISMSCQREVFSEVYTDGLIALNEKKYDEALVYLSRAIKLEPDFAETYFLRATAYYEMKNYEKAISDYTSCIKYNPSHDRAYLFRGISYEEMESIENAISDYTRAIELNPDDSNYYNIRGSLYYMNSEKYDISLALEDFKKGCELGDKRACYEFNSIKYLMHLKINKDK